MKKEKPIGFWKWFLNNKLFHTLTIGITILYLLILMINDNSFLFSLSSFLKSFLLMIAIIILSCLNLVILFYIYWIDYKTAKLVSNWLKITSYILIGYLAIINVERIGYVIGAGIISIFCGIFCSKWAYKNKESPNIAYIIGFLFSLFGFFIYWVYLWINKAKKRDDKLQKKAKKK